MSLTNDFFFLVDAEGPLSRSAHDGDDGDDSDVGDALRKELGSDRNSSSSGSGSGTVSAEPAAGPLLGLPGLPGGLPGDAAGAPGLGSQGSASEPTTSGRGALATEPDGNQEPMAADAPASSSQQALQLTESKPYQQKQQKQQQQKPELGPDADQPTPPASHALQSAAQRELGSHSQPQPRVLSVPSHFDSQSQTLSHGYSPAGRGQRDKLDCASFSPRAHPGAGPASQAEEQRRPLTVAQVGVVDVVGDFDATPSPVSIAHKLHAAVVDTPFSSRSIEASPPEPVLVPVPVPVSEPESRRELPTPSAPIASSPVSTVLHDQFATSVVAKTIDNTADPDADVFDSDFNSDSDSDLDCDAEDMQNLEDERSRYSLLNKNKRKRRKPRLDAEPWPLGSPEQTPRNEPEIPPLSTLLPPAASSPPASPVTSTSLESRRLSRTVAQLSTVEEVTEPGTNSEFTVTDDSRSRASDDVRPFRRSKPVFAGLELAGADSGVSPDAASSPNFIHPHSLPSTNPPTEFGGSEQGSESASTGTTGTGAGTGTGSGLGSGMGIATTARVVAALNSLKRAAKKKKDRPPGLRRKASVMWDVEPWPNSGEMDEEAVSTGSPTPTRVLFGECGRQMLGAVKEEDLLPEQVVEDAQDGTDRCPGNVEQPESGEVLGSEVPHQQEPEPQQQHTQPAEFPKEPAEVKSRQSEPEPGPATVHQEESAIAETMQELDPTVALAAEAGAVDTTPAEQSIPVLVPPAPVEEVPSAETTADEEPVSAVGSSGELPPREVPIETAVSKAVKEIVLEPVDGPIHEPSQPDLVPGLEHESKPWVTETAFAKESVTDLNNVPEAAAASSLAEEPSAPVDEISRTADFAGLAEETVESVTEDRALPVDGESVQVSEHEEKAVVEVKIKKQFEQPTQPTIKEPIPSLEPQPEPEAAPDASRISHPAGEPVPEASPEPVKKAVDTKDDDSEETALAAGGAESQEEGSVVNVPLSTPAKDGSQTPREEAKKTRVQVLAKLQELDDDGGVKVTEEEIVVPSPQEQEQEEEEADTTRTAVNEATVEIEEDDADPAAVPIKSKPTIGLGLIPDASDPYPPGAPSPTLLSPEMSTSETGEEALIVLEEQVMSLLPVQESSNMVREQSREQDLKDAEQQSKRTKTSEGEDEESVEIPVHGVLIMADEEEKEQEGDRVVDRASVEDGSEQGHDKTSSEADVAAEAVLTEDEVQLSDKVKEEILVAADEAAAVVEDKVEEKDARDQADKAEASSLVQPAENVDGKDNTAGNDAEVNEAAGHDKKEDDKEAEVKMEGHRLSSGSGLGRMDSETIPRALRDPAYAKELEEKRQSRERSQSPEPVQRSFSFPEDIADEDVFTTRDPTADDNSNDNSSINNAIGNSTDKKQVQETDPQDMPICLPRLSNFHEFMRSHTSLPTVEEELSEEEENGEPIKKTPSPEERQEKRSRLNLRGKRRIPGPPSGAQMHRDSGFEAETTSPRIPPPTEAVQPLHVHRDSGVHLDSPRSLSPRIASPALLPPTTPSPLRGHQQQSRALGPETPRLAEPSPPSTTPEPEKLSVAKTRGVGAPGVSVASPDNGVQQLQKALQKQRSVSDSWQPVGSGPSPSANPNPNASPSPSHSNSRSISTGLPLGAAGAGAAAVPPRRVISPNTVTVVANTGISRLRTPEPLHLNPSVSPLRPDTPGTSPLRRVAKRPASGDLRSVSRTQTQPATFSRTLSPAAGLVTANPATSSVVGGAPLSSASPSPSPSPAPGTVAAGALPASAITPPVRLPQPLSSNTTTNTPPVANEGRARTREMTDVYVSAVPLHFFFFFC